MIGGIVEVADSGRHLAVYRGFLKVTEDGDELGRVPLDDISALILSGPQITLSKSLLVALAERKSVVVTCGRNWHPVSMTLPFGAHRESAGTLRDQIDASAPLRKRLWQQLVRAKIDHQATVLRDRHPEHPKLGELARLSKRVKSGDPENLEAQAARHYWPALMGADFRRDRFGQDGNVFLNYGYTVLRAATARAVCGAGLHPALGLHHGSQVNDFALVDDLMEPFRPLVDHVAIELCDEIAAEEQSFDLTPVRKRTLAAVLQLDLDSGNGASPLANCLAALARSLVVSLNEKVPRLSVARIRTSGQLL